MADRSYNFTAKVPSDRMVLLPDPKTTIVHCWFAWHRRCINSRARLWQWRPGLGLRNRPWPSRARWAIPPAYYQPDTAEQQVQRGSFGDEGRVADHQLEFAHGTAFPMPSSVSAEWAWPFAREVQASV